MASCQGRNRIVGALALIALVSLGGCNSKRVVGVASPAPTDTPNVVITEEMAQRALISTADVEAGWSAIDFTDSGSATAIGGKQGSDNPPVPAKIRLLKGFMEGGKPSLFELKSFISNTILVFDKEDGARHMLDAYRAAAVTPVWDLTDKEGTHHFKLAEMAYPVLGDETFATRLDETLDGANGGGQISSSVEYVVIRVGQAVSVVFAGDGPSIDFAKKSTGKLKQLVAGTI